VKLGFFGPRAARGYWRAHIAELPAGRRGPNQGAHTSPDSRPSEGESGDNPDCIAALTFTDGTTDAGPEDRGGDPEYEGANPGAVAGVSAADPERIDGGDVNCRVGGELKGRGVASDRVEGSFQAVALNSQEPDALTWLKVLEPRRQ
jgi:hypothetical protein